MYWNRNVARESAKKLYGLDLDNSLLNVIEYHINQGTIKAEILSVKYGKTELEFEINGILVIVKYKHETCSIIRFLPFRNNDSH
jgi:hypothetical protein